MEYQEFKVMIQKRMQEIMGDAIEVGFETYLKNNHTEIEVMTLKKKGLQTKVMLSPAIHLQDLYILYKKEGDSEKFHACLVEIKKLYMEQESKGLDFIDRDWDSIKGSICMNLLYEDWNKEWLEEEEVSHCKFLNFVIVLRSIVDISSQGIGSMVVTKELMSYWQITEEELWAAAWENLYQERFYIQSMNDVIKSEIREHEMDIDYKEMDSMLPLYVLSNQKRAYGARAILRTDLLQAFAMGAGRNLYILPSSVHELILIPDNGNYSVDDMRETVRTINETQVPEQDRLSDTIYYFQKDSGTIEIAE